jgi:two-component system, cell cycle response regulator
MRNGGENVSGARAGRILVVDDSRVVRAVLCRALRGGGYEPEEAESGLEALDRLSRGEHDAVITDLRMPGIDGFGVLEEVKRRDPDVEVIVLTGSHAGDVACAVRALRLGAHDYLAKRPSCPEEVLVTVERAMEKKRLKDANRRLVAELDRMSRRDALTGLLNRRSLQDVLPQEVARSRRHGQPLGVAVFDLDHFKHINDTYGHQGGDVVLQAFAAVASETLREGDALYRYGGEEFVALLPNADAAGALSAARRVVAAVASTPVAVRDLRVRMTVSAGVAALTEDLADGDALVARADQALYEAKQAGRNRALVHTPVGPAPRRTRRAARVAA